MELSGRWWLPEEDPNRAIGGVLRHSRTGPTRLELFGALAGMDGSSQQRHIWGISTDGRAVTLSDCFQVGHRLSKGSAFSESEEWHVSRGLLGGHVSDLDKVEFDTATIRVDLLPSLTEHPSFRLELQPDRSVTIETPPELTARWREIDVTLGFPDSFHSDHITFDYQSEPVLTCDPPTAMRLADLQDQLLSPLKNLVSLFAGRPASTMAVELRLPNTRMRGDKYVDPPLKLFYNPIGSSEPIEQLVLPMFQLREQAVFESVVPQWLEASYAGEASSAILQFFSTQDAPAGFVELRFLSLVYTAEDYHRSRFGSAVQSSGAHDHRHSRNAKRPARVPLAKRIRSLVNVVNPQLDYLITHPGRFAELVQNTRNYLTHRTPDNRDRAASGSALFWLEQSMKLVMAAVVASETGLTDDAIHDGFARNQSLRWVRDHTRHEPWGHT